MANYYLFATNGDWDSTSLFRNGEEFPASQLYIELQTPHDYDGKPLRNGIQQGAEMTAYAASQGEGDQVPIFPGKIDLEFPTHKVSIENQTPQFAIEFTRVWLDQVDVTDNVSEVMVNIDAVRNEVNAYLVLFKPHTFAADEVATYTLI